MSVSSRLRSVLVGSAVVLFATLGIAAPASAHDALDGSDPAPGSSVEVAPAQVNLSFTAELMPDGAEAQVFEGADPVAASQAGATDWSAGAAVVDGTSLIIPLQEAMPAGTYSVNWRVVSSDGHAISTSSAAIVSFTVTTGSVPEPSAEQTPSASPEPSATATADVAPTPAATDDSSAADALPGVSPLVIGALVIGGAILLALLAVIIRVARKS